MSRLTRVRSVSRAVSREVARMWQRTGGRLFAPRSPLPHYQMDPLEGRIMLVAPSINTIPAQTTDEGKTISVNASFTDSDGSCGSYSACITWGDGTCSTCLSVCTCSSCCGSVSGNVNASHVYADNQANNQAYTATLYINDGSSTGSRTFSVTVRDVPPTLTMGGAATVNEGSSYTLTLAKSDHGTDTLGNWNIVWGDGNTSTPAGSTTSTTHTFASNYGHPSVTVTASDEDGGPYTARKVSQDTAFGSAGLVSSPSLGRVQALAVEPDGKILAAFGNGGAGIDKDFIIARFSASGSADSGFGDYVSGSSGPRKGYTVVDFGSNSSDYASSVLYLTVNGSGKIYVAGSRSSGGTNDFAVLRFNASDGTLDNNFGTSGKVAIDFSGGYDYAYGMAVQGNKIVLAGSAETSSGSNNFDFAVARINLDGSLDTGTTGDTDTSDWFGNYVSGSSGPHTGKKTLDFQSTSNSAYDVAIEPFTNNIVLGGTVSTTQGQGNNLAVARFTPDGAVDTTFGPLVSGSTHQGWAMVDVRSTDDNGRAVLIQDDGKIVVGGSSLSTSGNLTDFALARWNDDGTLDDGSSSDTTPNDRFGSGGPPPTPGTVLTNFAYGSDEAMRAMMQVDGRLVAVGYATGVYGGTDFAAARYMPDGSLDQTFGDGGRFTTDYSTWGCSGITVSNEVGYAAALQADGKILVGGVKGTSTAIIRYQPQSTLDVWVIPSDPTNLAASNISDATVQLSWTDHSSVETGFVIQRSGDSGTTWTDVGTVGANVTTYQAAGLSDATPYQFRVFAVNGTYRSNSATTPVSSTTNVKANPDFAYVGQAVHLRAPVGGSGSAVYIWSIAKGDQPYVSGTGSTFDFTPDSAGTYYVKMYTLDGGTTTASTQTILVQDQAPNGVKLLGPNASFDGHAIALTAQWPPPENPFEPHEVLQATYHWSVTKNGSPFTITPSDVASFRFIPADVPATPVNASDTYVVTVDVTQGGATTTLSHTITVTHRPTDKQYTTATTIASDYGMLAHAVAVQPDGKILVAGQSDQGSLVIRYNPDMTIDTTFGTDGMATITQTIGETTYPLGTDVHKLLIQPDGYIIALGDAIVRYQPDGTVDDSFDNRPLDSSELHLEYSIEDGALLPDGKILIGGPAVVSYRLTDGESFWNGHGGWGVARLTATGELDHTFGGVYDSYNSSPTLDATMNPEDPSEERVGYYIVREGVQDMTYDTVHALLVQPSGKIVLGGHTVFSTGEDPDIADPAGVLEAALIRFTDDGQLDTSFGTDGTVKETFTNLDDMTMTSGGEMIITGSTPSEDTLDSNGYPTNQPVVAEITADGALDTTFASGGIFIGSLPDNYNPAPGIGSGWGQTRWALARADDGQLYISGYTNADDFVVMHLDKTGQLDTDFGGEGEPLFHVSFNPPDHTNAPSGTTYSDVISQAWDIAIHPDGIVVVGAAQLTDYPYPIWSHYGVALIQPPVTGADDLSATARPDGPIDLRWVDGGWREDGFGIERWDPTLQEFVDIGYVGPNVTSFTDVNVEPQTTYTYRVYAFVATGGTTPALVRKGQSNEASATTAAPFGTQYKLQEIVRVPVDGDHVSSKTNLLDGGSYILRASGYFDLSPSDDPGGTKHADAEYGLWRPVPYDINPWSWHVNYGIAVADLGITDHHDLRLFWGDVSKDSDHSYRLAYTGHGGPLDLWYRDDLYSDNEQVTVGSTTKPYEMLVSVYRMVPTAPIHLNATPNPKASPRSVHLTWQDHSSNEQWFSIERATGTGSFSEIAKVPADQTDFTDDNNGAGLSLDTRYTYRVRAHTANDDSDYSNQAVTALISNHTPSFDAIADQTAVAGKEFFYRVHAVDPDEPWLKLNYSLEGTGVPSGMTVDDAGYIHGWTATTAGSPRTITVRASNPNDSTDTATLSFQLSVVNAASGIPTITSSDYTFEEPYQVHLTAAATQGGSPNGLTYTWSVVRAPYGAALPVFSASNGTIDGTAVTATFDSSGVAGDYVFRVSVADPTGLTNTADVTATVAQVPTTLRIQPRNAAVALNGTYLFTADLRDQFRKSIDEDDGPTLTWTVDGGSSTDGYAVNLGAGNVAGVHILHVSGGGLSDTTQFFNHTNGTPVIKSISARPDPNNPQASPAPPTKVWLTASATDDTAATLSYTWQLVTGPGSVTFDPSSGIGKRVSASFSTSGVYTFRVTVSDGTNSATKDVTFDDTPNLTSLVVSPGVVNLTPGASGVTLSASGLDQFGRSYDISSIASGISWSLDGGTPVTGSTYSWNPPSNEGTSTVTATLNSLIGAATLKTVAQAKPVVKIFKPVAQARAAVFSGGIQISPPADVLDPATIDKDTDVYVTVDDPNLDAPNDGAVTWTLTAVPADGGSPITLASGTHELGVNSPDGQKIATIHPLLLPQGLYTLKLTGDDGTSGDPSVDTQQFVVKTPLKLGNFTLPVTDLTVQGHGLPITISRVYDSSRANKYDSTATNAAGDFGPGWRLEMPDTDMQVTATASRNTEKDTAAGAYPAFFPGDAVYFTLPGGDVEGFRFTPQYLGQFHDPQLYFTYKPAFTALNNSTSRLTVDWSHPGETIQRELRLDLNTGELYELTTDGELDFNPARSQFGGHYLLTTHDGTQYDIDATTGFVRTVTDTNGNTLKYNLSGGKLASIDSYNKNATGTPPKTTVTIHRYSDGRIGWIQDDISTSTNPNATEPDAHSIRYAYNDNFTVSTVDHPGELASFTDRAANKTQYAYSTAASLRYHLTSVTDPRNLVVLSATYDGATGQMLTLSDPYKKTAQMGDNSFAGDDARTSVKDLAGNGTEMEYDERGRAVREIRELKDAAGNVSGYRVSVTKYEDQVTDDNEIGGLSKVIKYRPFTLTLAQKDQRHDFMPSVVSSTLTFDKQGNIAQQIDADGRTTALSGYTTLASDDHPVKPTDSRPTLVGDAYGNDTIFHYDSASGNLDHTTNAGSETTLYSYGDSSGNVTQVALDRGDPGPDPQGVHDDVPTSQSEYNGPDGQISVSKSDFRKNASGNWVAMSERDYDYTPATIGGVSYRQEKVTLKWRDTPDTPDANRHSLVENITLYNADDRTWKLTDSNGRTTETQYNSLGKVAVTIDPFGGRTTYDYDVRGNLIRALYPDGTETRTVYDVLGRVTWETVRYASGSNCLTGYIDNTTTALATLTVYDDVGRVTQMWQYQGVLVRLDSDTAFGPNATVLTSSALGGTSLSTLPASGTQYDSEGRPYLATDAAGVITQTSYYDDGRIKGTSQNGTRILLTRDTSYAYDFTDSSGLHRQDRVTDALNHTTTTDYDALGQAVKVTYDDDSFTETLYGVNSQPVSRNDLPSLPSDFPSTFNGQHVVKVGQRKSTDTTPLAITHYLYDTEGRLTDVWQRLHSGSTDSWPHWHYTYDGMGNLTAQTDPQARTTTFVYDDHGRRTERRLPDDTQSSQHREVTTYDSFGRVFTKKDFKGQTTAYQYDDSADGQGRLFAEYRFAAGVTATDSANAIIKANAAERSEYSYDPLGRQSQVREYASGTGTTAARTTNYSYDPVTGAVSLVDSNEGKVHHEYDPTTGLLIETWTGNTKTSATTDTLYGYDQFGRLASVSSAKINGAAPTAPAIRHERDDAAGNVLQTAADNALPTSLYVYDADGNLDKVLLPDGLTTDYTYDDLNRLSLETVTRDDPSTANTIETRPVLRFDYNYYDSGAADEDHRRRLMIESDGQRGGVVETRYNAAGNAFSTNYIDYEYDTLGRLTKETRDQDNDGNDDTYDSITSYAYDSVGNRLSETFDSPDNTKDDTVTYRYGEVDGSFNLTSTDANDHLRWERHVVNGVTTTIEYRYDANGSTTEKITTGGSSSDIKYVWDLRNRLVGLDANGDGDTLDSGDVNYAYDTDGDRVSQTPAGGATTYYLVDKGNPTSYSQPLEERIGTTLTTTYVIGADVIAQARSSQSHALEYLLYDGHGSTRAIAKATVNSFSDSLIVANSEIDYDAFGTAAGLVSLDTANSVSELLYSGEQYDSSLKEQYLRNRYYNQFIGRFSSFDSFEGSTETPLSLHKYVYTEDSPSNGIDPSGNADVTLTGIIVSTGIGAAVGAWEGYHKGHRGWELAEDILNYALVANLFYLASLTPAGPFAWCIAMSMGLNGTVDAIMKGDWELALGRAALTSLGGVFVPEVGSPEFVTPPREISVGGGSSEGPPEIPSGIKGNAANISKGPHDMSSLNCEYYVWKSPDGRSFDILLKDARIAEGRMTVSEAHIFPSDSVVEGATLGRQGVRQLKADFAARFKVKELEITNEIQRTTSDELRGQKVRQIPPRTYPLE
jgi:uncharacterized delta-60 repeat protein/RHS repeat-associated protein